MCLTHVNHKETSDEPVRVVAVVPIWPADLPDHDVELSPLGKSGRDGLNIYVSGADFAGYGHFLFLNLPVMKSKS